jgi:ketosteroid isomerase-like protein
MKNVDIVKNAYAAFGRGDIPSVLGAMHPEMEWHEAEGNPYMPSGAPFVGPDEVLNKLFVRLGEEWDSFTVHPNTFYEAGNTVVVEGRYTGTFKDTGKDMDIQVCHIWTILDGKLKKFQQYVNTAALQEVMGAVSVS